LDVDRTFTGDFVADQDGSPTKPCLVRRFPKVLGYRSASLTYTLVVENRSQNSTDNAIVELVAANDLIGLTWTSVTTGGATASPSGTGEIHEVVTLPPSARIIYDLGDGVSAGCELFAAYCASFWRCHARIIDPCAANVRRHNFSSAAWKKERLRG